MGVRALEQRVSRLEQRVSAPGLESWTTDDLLRAAYLLEKDIHSNNPMTSDEQKELDAFNSRMVSLPQKFTHMSEEELERKVQALREELKDYGYGSDLIRPTVPDFT